MSRRRRSGGYTLIEVLTVAIMLGVLAGISTPMLARAIHRAGAAKVVADAHNMTLAVRAFSAAGGTLPETSEWGVAPTGLATTGSYASPAARRFRAPTGSRCPRARRPRMPGPPSPRDAA
jgi:prepilin-type N-terminal cleavage/methylation domain-containing protein